MKGAINTSAPLTKRAVLLTSTNTPNKYSEQTYGSSPPNPSRGFVRLYVFTVWVWIYVPSLIGWPRIVQLLGALVSEKKLLYCIHIDIHAIYCSFLSIHVQPTYFILTCALQNSLQLFGFGCKIPEVLELHAMML